MAKASASEARIGLNIVRQNTLKRRAAPPSFAANPQLYMGKSEAAAVRPTVGRRSNWSAKYAKIAPKIDKNVIPAGYDVSLVHSARLIENFDFTPNDISAQKMPELKYLPVGSLLVDHNWQRVMQGADLGLLREICEGFNWLEFKALNVAMVRQGKDIAYYVTNGQKSLTAALHRQIPEVPCLCSWVSEEQRISLMAKCFVSLNTKQTPVQRADIFTAEHYAGDEAARGTATILLKHGIQIVRDTNRKAADFGTKESRVVDTFKGIFEKHGGDFLDSICQVAANANFRPIRAMHLRALVRLFTAYKSVEPARLIKAVNVELDKHVLNAAKLRALSRKVPKPEALAEIYWEKYRAIR